MELEEAASPSKIPSTSTRENKTQRLRERAKAKTKKILHISSPSSSDESSYEAAQDELQESPAFNPDKFLNQAHVRQSGSSPKAAAFLQGVQNTVEAVIHPKAAIQSRATRKTAGSLAKSRPYLSRKADLDFLQAHEDLEEAIGDDESNGKDGDLSNDRIDGCTDHIQEMERKRQGIRVAWVTTRHVYRVRAVDANPPPFPDDEFFIVNDDCGYPEFQLGKWIAYKALNISHGFSAQYIDDFEELPFDFDTLRRHVERLVIVSAPLQEFVSDLRSIYRWQDPARTGKWMVLYFGLWYISHIMTFTYGYIFYSTIMNDFYPPTVADLRAEMSRSFDRGATAFKVGELMDKHGSDNWLEPLLDQVGPYIQVQIGDLASFLEAAYNFYHFQSPAATIASLCFVAALFLLTALVDSRYAMKVLWFMIGLIFFICWPISSLSPRFRLLVSPLKWMLWDVPSHSELSFQFLQERAAVARESIISDHHRENSDPDVTRGSALRSDSDGQDVSDDESFVTSATSFENEDLAILSFDCIFQHIPGHFTISTTGVRFDPSINHFSNSMAAFYKPYSELLEMSKRQTHSSILSPLAKVTSGMDKLELRFRGNFGVAGVPGIGEMVEEEVLLLENMRGRDKAFNAIIGFSGVRWQHLQKRPKSEGKKGRHTVAR
ncbi:hypothetical protein BKA64DRAFT_481465 [Cadophora sp. MPI-SDFR-AT-0126]|nr:hypothetical protein BKA64DRAFT_481465 [Leotiomycetes sp. MPI-SDFR-AT-0126]